MLMSNFTPSMLISYLFVLLTAFSVHEFAHAWTANYFGDDTPRQNGRLTLNPLKHLDPLGSILLLFAGFGWAKPVPVNPYALQRRSPAALMWVSLAGPMSNLLMAIIAAIPFRLGLVTTMDAQLSMLTKGQHFLPTISQLLYVFISTNLLLMLFNLIPLAPLDGEKIAAYLLPPSWSRGLDAIRPYGPIILIAIFSLSLININVFGYIIIPPLNFLTGLLMG
jgi:Zn-dependent protease